MPNVITEVPDEFDLDVRTVGLATRTPRADLSVDHCPETLQEGCTHDGCQTFGDATPCGCPPHTPTDEGSCPRPTCEDPCPWPEPHDPDPEDPKPKPDEEPPK